MERTTHSFSPSPKYHIVWLIIDEIMDPLFLCM
jgi:hypothetical protein